MSSELENALVSTLIGLQKRFRFLDDIIVVNIGSKSEHLNYLTKLLKKTYDSNLGINLEKCHLPQSENE